MRFKDISESRRITTGVSGKFKTIEKDDGSKAMLFQAGDKKYILKTSLKNFVRFQKWEGKESIADIQKIGSIVINKVRYPLIKIRTDIKIEEESYIAETKKIENMKTAGEIYYAGKNWKQFDFDKGLDALIKIDGTGKWIYNAGRIWKQFDYKKGSDGLIKIDKDGKFIYWAGTDWKRFDYDKGLKALKNTQYHEYTIKHWPKGIKQSQSKIKRIAKTAKKLPMKKLKLKESERAAELLYIVNKGEEEGYSDNLLKNLIAEIGKTGGYSWRFFNMAIHNWPNFNYSKAEQIIKDSDKLTDSVKSGLLSSFPMNINQSRMKAKLIRKGAKKMPMKKLKLKESIKQLL